MPAQFSESETSRHMRSSGACTANMSEFEFLVHTPGIAVMPSALQQDQNTPIIGQGCTNLAGRSLHRLLPIACVTLALLSRTLLFDGTVQASDCFGAGSPGVVWAVQRCHPTSDS